MRTVWISIFSVLALTPGAACAAENLGTSSSGSITIRVEVPPFAAALQAQAEGAVGINSVIDTKSAIMVSLPSTLSGAETASAALFYGSDMPVTLSPTASDQVRLTPTNAERLNGMVRQSFDLSNMTSLQQPAGQPAGMTFIVAPV